MKADARFLKERSADWSRLAGYSARLGGGGTARLTSRELMEFVGLYRRATADLARARTLGVRSEVVDYLNQLVGRIHFQIYVRSGFSIAGALRFFTAGFPQAVRRHAAWILIATAMFLAPALAAYACVAIEPALGRVFAGPFYDQVGHYDETGRTPGQVAHMTGFYIANNVGVAIKAFALGIFAGLGSALALLYNGAILGAMAAVIAQHGHSFPFWSFVSSHAAVELGAIVIAGAAGMMIGSKLINPGPFTRLQALGEAGREGALLIVGVVAMLCLAAVIEAAVSPSKLPGSIRIAFGIFNLILMIAYFALAGRTDRRNALPAPVESNADRVRRVTS